jgi:two-component system sensor histidine kinase QseC
MIASSLRRRLLALLLTTVVCGWIATGLVGYFDARHEAHELFDAHLAQTASLLVTQASEKNGEIDTEHAPLLHPQSRRTAFQVWERGSSLRLHSANAPDVRLSERDEGFSDVMHAGIVWRVFSAWDSRRDYLVQVAERQDSRDDVAGALAKSLALSMLGVLPLLAAALWFAVTQGLRPLDRLRPDLAKREAGNLSPLQTTDVPEEVRPLVDELNRLFARIAEVLDRERRFTADAAHELRTPLAALRSQAQLARAARGEAVRDEALTGILAGTDRATRLVEQLLTLARVDSGEAHALAQALDLRELVRAELAEVAPRALASNIELVFADGAEVQITGHPGLLKVLARNLLDNAVRYTPNGGRLGVAVEVAGGLARLSVTNSGPALSTEDISHLGERFFRVIGNAQNGSGLGLSIVTRIAELHRGCVRIAAGDDDKGLRVEVALPQSRPEEPAPPAN